MKIFKLFFIVLILSSCHHNSIDQITLKIKSSVPDKIQLFINESYVGNYDENLSQTQDISAGSNQISFILSDYKKIKSLRIDLGNALVARDFKIDEITIISNNKKKVIMGNDLKTYFEGNYEVTFDSSGYFQLQKPETKDPYIISKNLSKLF